MLVTYGAAWRKNSGVDQQRDSTIEEAVGNTNLPIPHGSSPLWGPGGVPTEWADVCGFVKPPNTDNEWHMRGHGASEIIRDVVGIRPTDQSCFGSINTPACCASHVVLSKRTFCPKNSDLLQAAKPLEDKKKPKEGYMVSPVYQPFIPPACPSRVFTPCVTE